MVRPGIHLKETLVTFVLRNGATVRVPSVVQMTQPRFLDTDPSNHPLWTGREVTEIKEESRAAKFLDRFGDVTGARSPGGGSRDGRETA